jgi:8-oxo-dGTP diphosphatase
MDTVVPLSGSVGVGVEAEDLLAEGSGRAALDLVRSLAGSSSVLCSHGDIIPELLAALANEDGIELGRHPRWEKASAWVLRSSGDRLVSAEYLPPPSREADA